MHLQQTKRGSRATGGPQYYFHKLAPQVKQYLRAERSVPVALVTPYGATPSKFLALAENAKLSPSGRVLDGRVGHDRIQQAEAGVSIGEAIRYWYKLKTGDFERIDVDIQILDGKFYLAPLACRYAASNKTKTLQVPVSPLSYNDRVQSDLWRSQLKHVEKARPEMWRWSIGEICRIASDHAKNGGLSHIREEDLLRASGPLAVLGIKLGPYVGKGYDCQSEFQFLNLEPYRAPVEIKKSSSGFQYQQRKYSAEELSRAVILCVRHDLVNVPPNVDVIQLQTLCSALDR